jgi:UDP-N-acetylmuramoylalanine-D-glutamate ligase
MGQTADKFKILCENVGIPYIVVSSLQDAVSTAVEQSKKLALIDVLYSP